MTFTATCLEWSRSRHCTTLAKVPFPSSFTTMSAGGTNMNRGEGNWEEGLSGMWTKRRCGEGNAGHHHNKRCLACWYIIESADMSNSRQLGGSCKSRVYIVRRLPLINYTIVHRIYIDVHTHILYIWTIYIDTQPNDTHYYTIIYVHLSGCLMAPELH